MIRKVITSNHISPNLIIDWLLIATLSFSPILIAVFGQPWPKVRHSLCSNKFLISLEHILYYWLVIAIMDLKQPDPPTPHDLTICGD